MSPSSSTGLLSLSRIMVIAGHTFTQLCRMKVFYFLVVIAIFLIGVNFFELPTSGAVASSAEEHIKMVKNMSFASMEAFSLLFGICATALLIPKDVEDRILYTILSKPVPRVDYLLGKLFGVLLIILVAILFMDLLLCIVVYARAEGIEFLGIQGLIDKELFFLEKDLLAKSFTEAEILRELEIKKTELSALSVTTNMQVGVMAIYLKTLIVSSVAMLLSTFSTSTLFTIIMSFVIYAIGMFQHEAKEAYAIMLEDGYEAFQPLKVGITVIFPDLHVFSVTDSVTQTSTETIALKHIVRMILLALMYSGLYTILSWFVFRKKEF